MHTSLAISFPSLRFVLVLLATCAGCRCGVGKASGPDCQLVENSFGPDGTVPVRAEVVASGLEVPWGLAFLPSGEILLTERPGRIRLFRNGQVLPQPVATLPISQSAEGGLLGIALDQDFANNRLFYVYVSTSQSGQPVNRVERWQLASDAQSASFDRVIVDRIPASQLHDGGRIRFGPDQMLYVGTGDARNPDSSQNLESLAGKLLRVTPDGTVPADNPFPGKPVFLYGIRNTQGFDWPAANTLYLLDHGPSGEYRGWTGHDEVNVVTAGDNLGWPAIYSCETRAGMVTPSLTWNEAVPPGGAAIYTGSAISEWRNSLLIGTLGSRHLHRVVFEPGSKRVRLHEVYFRGDPPGGYGRLRETIMGPDGQLYVTTSNCDGRGQCPADKDKILRIVPR
jgi:glucose/arabinose dehydrogenase